VIVPSSALETLGLGSMDGLTALTMRFRQDKSDREKVKADKMNEVKKHLSGNQV